MRDIRRYRVLGYCFGEAASSVIVLGYCYDGEDGDFRIWAIVETAQDLMVLLAFSELNLKHGDNVHRGKCYVLIELLFSFRFH